MSCERKLLIHGEDTHLNAAFALGGKITREDERGFREAGLTRQGLHVGRGEAACVGEDRQLIAFQRLLREHIELHVWEAAHIFLPGGGVGNFPAKAYPSRS